MFLFILTGSSLLILLFLVDHHLHYAMHFFLWQHLSLASSTQLFLSPAWWMTTFCIRQSSLLPTWTDRSSLVWHWVALNVTSWASCPVSTMLTSDICKPLYYLLLMNWHLYRLTAVSSWTSGTFDALIDTVCTMRFPFYGFKEINHFYCELPIVLHP